MFYTASVFVEVKKQPHQQMTNLRIRQEAFDSQTINSYWRQYTDWFRQYFMLFWWLKFECIRSFVVFCVSCSHLFQYWHFWYAFDRNTFDQIRSIVCSVFVQASARLWICESVWKLIFHFAMVFFSRNRSSMYKHLQAMWVCVCVSSHVNIVRMYFCWKEEEEFPFGWSDVTQCQMYECSGIQPEIIKS